MKLFVTGASGYLGFHFVNVAVNKGYDVLCLKRETSKSLFDCNIEQQIKWVVDNDSLKDELIAYKPDVLVHFAWGGVRGLSRDSVEIQIHNEEMSKRIFCLYPYKQIISIGSQSEYGYYNEKVNEEYPLKPLTEYAISKVRCCDFLKQYCENNNIEWQWIRVFTIYGEHQTGGLIKLFVEKCLSNETSFSTTKGNQLYSYLYAADFALALCNVLGEKGKSGIYNLSQPFEIVSNRELLERIKILLNSKIRIDFGAIPYSRNQIMIMDGNVGKFVHTFGPIPHTDFLLGLQKTINSFICESI